MEDLLRTALRAAERLGATAAEVRVYDPMRYESLSVRNGDASALTATVRRGLGIRVRTKTSWGFAATPELTTGAARESARRALKVATAGGLAAGEPLLLAPLRGPTNGRYSSRVKVDPFAVPLDEKIALLVEAEKRVHVGPEIKSGESSYQAWHEIKWFASSEGVQYRSDITHVGAGLEATAIASGEVQRRSAPNSFGGDYCQAGFEFVRALNLLEHGSEAGEEAIRLLTARPCPKATTTVILGSSQAALQVHESVGHAVELDRIFGTEAAFAGRSWVTPEAFGRLTYGSSLMNVVADAKVAGGLGTFGWDDEGAPAARTPIVRRGALVGALTSRETAPRLHLSRSGATARAAGFDRAPLIRMTNVNLEPGDYSGEELCEGVSDGVFFETNRSWSIDDKRLNFQFGTEVGRRIVRGALGELVRNPIYSGMTPEFWRSMDAVGDTSTWHLWGIPNCGKGEPQQTARVGHGAPWVRFRHVRVWGG